MVEMEVHRVQVSSRAYHRVVLRAKDGDANLHIVIGPAEARAISLAHRGQKAQRPLSYDMARSLLQEAGASIQRVAITDLQDGIYYAEIRLTDDDGQERVVDSRPSDAIALALRMGAPIFAAETVLEDDEEDWDEEVDLEAVEVEVAEPPEGAVSLAELLADSEPDLSERQQLEKRLRQAVAEEAYEEAARLRDRLEKLA
jgi:hypothetical protein